MLIVGPNSTCDICMESYGDGAGIPYAITCGHIFCRTCLDRMHRMQPQCPICRKEFSLRDIHQLRVDFDAPSSATVMPQVDSQAQRLLEGVAKAAEGRATVEEIQKVIDMCNACHDGSSYTPLGISHLLLSALLEAQRRLLSQAEQLSTLAAARDDVRDRLTLELDAMRLQYQNSERARRDEKETAQRNEEAFRAQYDKMNVFWKGKVESTKLKYRTLREELHRLHQTNQTTTHGMASSVIGRCGAAISCPVVAAGDFPEEAETVDKVKLAAIPSWKLFFLLFGLVLSVMSVGYVMVVTTSTVAFRSSAK